MASLFPLHVHPLQQPLLFSVHIWVQTPTCLEKGNCWGIFVGRRCGRRCHARGKQAENKG